MRYEILDAEGYIINVINADQGFVNEYYPNSYRAVQEVERPLLVDPIKTDEEKLADAISAAVAKLIADGVLKQA